MRTRKFWRIPLHIALPIATKLERKKQTVCFCKTIFEKFLAPSAANSATEIAGRHGPQKQSCLCKVLPALFSCACVVFGKAMSCPNQLTSVYGMKDLCNVRIAEPAMPQPCTQKKAQHQSCLQSADLGDMVQFHLLDALIAQEHRILLHIALRKPPANRPCSKCFGFEANTAMFSAFTALAATSTNFSLEKASYSLNCVASLRRC